MTRRLVAAIALALAALLPQGSSAATTITGVGSFEGSVTLPTMPCSCPGGLFNGTVGLTLSGVSDVFLDGVSLPYTAVWEGLNNASASFGYDESCLPEQPDSTPPLTGSANGLITVSGGHLAVGASLLPATLSGGFTWQRIGTAVHVTFFSLTITAGSTIAVNLTNTIEGQSAAGFSFTTLPVGTCVSPASPQGGAVVGVALQVV